MKKTTKVLAWMLLCAMLLGLCACGEKKDVQSNSGSKTEDGKTVWYLGGNNPMAGKVDVPALFASVADTVDPGKIYSSVPLTEEMLHGVYTLDNKEKDLKTVRKEIPMELIQFKNSSRELSILPTAVYLGAEHICNTETRYNYSEFEAIEDYEVAVLELTAAEQIGQTPCIYQIDGDKITFKQIEQTSAEGAPFTYALTGVEFVYNFTLSGPYMTFSRDGHSLQLKAYCLTKNADDSLSMQGYSLPDSPLIQGVDYFASADAWNYAVTRDGSYIDITAYKLDDEGRFTMYAAERNLVTGEKDETFAQYAYIMQSEASAFGSDFCMILLDGSKIYYYTDDITMREARALKEQGADLNGLTDDQIKEIAQKKADLFDELQEAFEAEGIKATVNRSTGEIALDSAVLFGVNESDVSAEGKEFLQKFIGVYTRVVLGEKYQGFISKIMVEGHTDTNGAYDMNKKLSQARADSVKTYCLSAECGMDATVANMLETVGYAYDKPIYGADGEVDMDASRRVSFRFVINLEKLG